MLACDSPAEAKRFPFFIHGALFVEGEDVVGIVFSFRVPLAVLYHGDIMQLLRSIYCTSYFGEIHFVEPSMLCSINCRGKCGPTE